MRVINTDPEYLNIMGMELVAGRNISWEMPTDKTKKYVINEEAVRFLGFESPVGEMVRMPCAASKESCFSLYPVNSLKIKNTLSMDQH